MNKKIKIITIMSVAIFLILIIISTVMVLKMVLHSKNDHSTPQTAEQHNPSSQAQIKTNASSAETGPIELQTSPLPR
jgi:flagellar basal body-associated protein FliL